MVFVPKIILKKQLVKTYLSELINKQQQQTSYFRNIKLLSIKQ